MILVSASLVFKRQGRPLVLAMLAASLSLRLALIGVLWGASYGPTRRSLMPVSMARTCSLGCPTSLPSMQTHGSLLCGSLPGACSVLLLLRMHHTRALMLPSVTLGGATCHTGLQVRPMWFSSLMPMLALARRCPAMSVVVVSASRRT